VQVWDGDRALVDRMSAAVEGVFVALHGGAGENGTVQTLLELAGLPYVGTRSANCRIAYDKAIAKTKLREQQLPTPAWVALSSEAFRDFGATAVTRLILARLGLPIMIKPDLGGSALGARVVHSVEDVPAALVEAYSYGHKVLVESYVDGHEVTVPILQLDGQYVPLQPVLIDAPGPYDYAARYDASSGVRYEHLSDDDDRVDVPALKRLAVDVHETLGLRHLSRVDIRHDAAGAPMVLEAAVTPGMTETSVWPMSVASSGLELAEVLTALLREAAADAPVWPGAWPTAPAEAEPGLDGTGSQ
jgi:D-alanine-D-alanine ligase